MRKVQTNFCLRCATKLESAPKTFPSSLFSGFLGHPVEAGHTFALTAPFASPHSFRMNF